MSRSIHHTQKSFFHLKPKAEVDAMCDPQALDPDVAELLKKSVFKRKSIQNRRSVDSAALAQLASEERESSN